jgi:hypothetical protein
MARPERTATPGWCRAASLLIRPICGAVTAWRGGEVPSAIPPCRSSTGYGLVLRLTVPGTDTSQASLMAVKCSSTRGTYSTELT